MQSPFIIYFPGCLIYTDQVLWAHIEKKFCDSRWSSVYKKPITDDIFWSTRPTQSHLFSHKSSVRTSPLFKFSKTKQQKTMFATGETVGLAEWIIDDTCLVILLFHSVYISLLISSLHDKRDGWCVFSWGLCVDMKSYFSTGREKIFLVLARATEKYSLVPLTILKCINATRKIYKYLTTKYTPSHARGLYSFIIRETRNFKTWIQLWHNSQLRSRCGQ